VGFVLLIACVNVASLFVAHGIDRVREITVRSALGATAWRISRQLLAETFLIAVCGAVCGFILAWWGVELLRSAIPGSIPRSAMIAINLRLLAFTAGTAVATAIVCGLLPALTLGRTDVAEGLKRVGARPRRARDGADLRRAWRVPKSPPRSCSSSALGCSSGASRA
jgi:ABC-type antimicrobial peptide transport system permease subunit